MKNSFITDFTTGNITKQLISFATPLFLSSLLQVAYNMVDMIIVGNVVGKTGLSAVSVGGDITTFLTFIAMGFSSAGQVIISQYIGSGKKDKVGKFVSTMFLSLSLCAFFLSFICYFVRTNVLNLMNTPIEAFDEAIGYSTVCIIGLFFIYGYNTASAVLRGIGDSKHPFIFISVAAILNIFLDVVFVVFCNMGAAGAALATVISQGTSFIMCVVFLIKSKDNLGFELSAKDFLKIDFSMLSDLTKLGVPMAIKSASIMFSKLFVNSFINSFGVAVSAFAGIANKINSISNLISNALNTAGSSMVGQNIGAKTYDRVPKIAIEIAKLTFVIAISMSLFIIIFPKPFFKIFTQDYDVIKIGMEYIPIAVLMFFGSACRAPANAIINGSGNYKVNFATAIFDGIILRLGLSALFGIAFGMKYLGFWLGDALAGFTPMVIGIVFYATGKWKENK